MSVSPNEAVAAATQRLDACYAGPECDWDRFFRPRREMANFATRYHLVYPALAYFITLYERSELADNVRPKLDTMYRGNIRRTLHRRLWRTARRHNRPRRALNDLPRPFRELASADDRVAELRRELLPPSIDGHVQCSYAHQQRFTRSALWHVLCLGKRGLDANAR